MMEKIKPQMKPNEGADYWYYEIGMNVIPVFSQNKGKTHEKDKHWTPIGSYDHWFNKEIPEDTFQQWKKQNLFDHGIAVIGGKVYRGNFKGYYLCMIDLDNQKGIDEIFPDGLVKAGHRTLIEQHVDRKDKAHVYFYTKESTHKKTASGNKEDGNTPAIEVKGEGPHGVHVVTPSIHTDGYPYEITSIVRYPVLVNTIEQQIQKVCEKYRIKYLDNIKQEEFDKTKYQEYTDTSYKIGESEGRRPALLTCCNHWFWERQEKLEDDNTKDEVLELARKWNKEHCEVLLSDEQVQYQVECAYKWSVKSKENGTLYPLITDGKEQAKQDLYDALRDQILSKYDFLCIDDKNRELFYFKDGKFSPGAESKVDTYIEFNIKGSDGTLRREVLNKVKLRTLTDRDKIDDDDDIINCKNTLFDIEKGKPKPHTPKHKSVIQWNVIYDEKAKCPNFLKFLCDVILEPKQRVMVLEMMAELLWKKSPLTKSYFLLGKGSNGKSILRDIIVEMVGDTNKSELKFEDFDDKFLPADLDAKIVNIPDEIDDAKIVRSANWKTVVAHRSMTVQRKNGQPFPITPYAKVIMPCNRPPPIEDKSDGTYRRIAPIHFDQTFTHNLTSKLKERGVKLADDDFTDSLLHENEISGIFNLLVGIVKNLKKRKHLRYGLTVEEVRQEWETLTNTTKEYIHDCLDKDDEGTALKTDYYRGYLKFCEEKNYKPDGQNTFYVNFQREGAISKKARINKNENPQWCFKGFWFKGADKTPIDDKKQIMLKSD